MVANNDRYLLKGWKKLFYNSGRLADSEHTKKYFLEYDSEK